ncbi:MAG: hypothetical protein RH942_19540 [Kiloniellaceae bacterium]
MDFHLIRYAPGLRGYLAEFRPGRDNGERWSERSVYMDGDVFEALVFLVGPFSMKRPVTVEGEGLGNLAEELEHVARQVSHADSPKAIWPYTAGYGYTQFNSVRDWPAERQAFTVLLRDLGAWMKARDDDGEPITIRHG